nr:MAG TPA: hypothetical protein [Caudoviricetes sp.]
MPTHYYPTGSLHKPLKSLLNVLQKEERIK